MFFRKEDADHGIAVSVQGQACGSMNKSAWVSNADLIPVAVGTDQAENPSPRRDGVAIQFWCEACPSTPVLHIYQHKGDTMINWSHSADG